jgi:hypothetical protein
MPSWRFRSVWIRLRGEQDLGPAAVQERDANLYAECQIGFAQVSCIE